MFKINKKNLSAFAACVLIFCLAAFIIPASRPHAINSLRYPLGLVNLIKREAAGIFFYHRNYIQNEQLKMQNDLLTQKLNNSNEVYRLNKRLLALLTFKDSQKYNVIAARVIGRDPSNWSSTIIIDRGRSSRVQKDFVCVSFLGLIGKVIEAGTNTAKILLLNDSNFGVSAIVQRSRQEGLVCGSLGGSLIMKYLPKDADIKAGDVVETSGLTVNFPKGVLIGSVVDVGDELSGLSRYAVIKPAVNLSSLEEVLVIIQ